MTLTYSHDRPSFGPIEDWLRSVTKQHPRTDRDTRGTDRQQRLVRAAGHGQAAFAAEVRSQIGAATALANDEAPLAAAVGGLRVPNSLWDPPMDWEDARQFHGTLGAAGWARSHAADFRWWVLLSLQLLDSHSLGNGLSTVLGSTSLNKGEDPAAISTKPARSLTDNERRALDRLVWGLTCRLGGAYYNRCHRMERQPVRIWWMAEVVRTAWDVVLPMTMQELKSTGAALRDEADLWDLLGKGQDTGNTGVWRVWVETAANMSARLSSPNLMAAYLLLASREKANAQSGAVGLTYSEIARTLVRRTQNLNVELVAPADLCRLV